MLWLLLAAVVMARSHKICIAAGRHIMVSETALESWSVEPFENFGHNFNFPGLAPRYMDDDANPDFEEELRRLVYSRIIMPEGAMIVVPVAERSHPHMSTPLERLIFWNAIRWTSDPNEEPVLWLTCHEDNVA
ncbi:hypothetical protein PYCC9005_003448 [Savitreella phatthalungensis]